MDIGTIAGYLGLISTMADALKKIGAMSWEEITKGLVGLSGTVAVLLVMIRSLSKMSGGDVPKIKLLSMIGVILTVAAFSGVMIKLSKLSWEEMARGLAGLVSVVTILGLFMKATGKLTGSSIKISQALLMLGMLTMVIVAFGFALDMVKGVDVKTMLAFAGSLSMIFLAVSASLAIMDKVGIGSSIKGALGIISALLLIIGAFALIGLIPGVAEKIENSGKVLKALSNALKNFSPALTAAILGIVAMGEAVSFVQGKTGTKSLLYGGFNSAIITATLGTVVAVIGAILTGLGWLEEVTYGGITSKIENGGRVIESISGAISNFSPALSAAVLGITAVGDAIAFIEARGGLGLMRKVAGKLGIKLSSVVKNTGKSGGAFTLLNGMANSSIITATIGTTVILAGSILAGIGWVDELNQGGVSQKIQNGGSIVKTIGEALSSFGPALTISMGGIVAISEAIAFIKGKGGMKTLLYGWANAAIITMTIATAVILVGGIMAGLGWLNESTNGIIASKIQSGGEILFPIADALNHFSPALIYSMDVIIVISEAIAFIKGKGGMKTLLYGWANAAIITMTIATAVILVGGIMAGLGWLNESTNGLVANQIEAGGKVVAVLAEALNNFSPALYGAIGGIVGISEAIAFIIGSRGTGYLLLGWLNSSILTSTIGTVAVLAEAIIAGIGEHDIYRGGADVAAIERGGEVLGAISGALKAFEGPLGIAAGALTAIGEGISYLFKGRGTGTLLLGWLDSAILTSTIGTVAVLAEAIIAGIGEHDIYRGGADVAAIERGGEVLSTVGNALKGFDGPLGIAALAIAAISDALGMLGLKGTIAVGLGFVNASIITATFGAIADIAAACTAGLGVWDRKNDGQLIADIERGGEVLNSVGGALANLASGFKEEGTRSITESLGILADADVDQEKVDAAIQSAQSLNSVIEAWTSSTPMGFLSTITGGLFRKKDRFSYLTTTIDDFASTMQSVNTSLATITDQTVLNAQTAIDAATKVAEFFDLIASDRFNLEANGGAWSKFWFGDNKTESFIEDLEGFGDNLNTFSEKVNSFSQGTTKDDLDVAIDALKKIAEVGMVTADMRFDPSVLSMVSSSITTFEGAYATASEELSKDNLDMSFVTDFSNAVSKIGNAVSVFTSTDTESFKTKMDALKGIFSTGEGASSETSSIFSNVSIDTKPITDACDKAVTAIRGYRAKFVTAGQYMASGLAQGIKMSAASARIAAENMARSALSGAQSILQIASPSKKTEEFGMYFSQGMARGISAYSSAVTSASSDVSQQALNSVRASISSMSGLLDENVSSDPVIRPIVDLTNVGEGARAIRSMLSGGSTISVGSNVDSARAASASISRANMNQNGSSSGNIDNSSVSSNAVNLSGNNFYIRSEQDIRSLASEIASLSYQQKRGLGSHA